MRYAPTFQRMLDYAAYDCGQRGGSEIAVDHLMLGLYREDFPLVDEVFSAFRVDPLKVLERLLQANPEGARPVEHAAVQMGVEAIAAVACAEREAELLGHTTITPSHTLLGILHYNRAQLARFFIREEIVKRREDEVLEQVRELVKWLRFSGNPNAERAIELLDRDTIVELEALRLSRGDGNRQSGYAVQIRMMKRLRST